MGAFLQGMAGFIYLVVTSGTAILMIAAYNDGAATVNQLQRFATHWVSNFNGDLVFYGILFLVWLFVSIPAFRLLGEAETNEWQGTVSQKLKTFEDRIQAQNDAASTTQELLREIRDELRKEKK